MRLVSIPDIPNTFEGLLVYVGGLVILWAVVSIPVYFSAKLLTKGGADFLDAMGATLGGVLVYLLVFFIIGFFLGSIMGPAADAFATILAMVGWFAVYRAAFRTSWVKAVGIVVLSWLVLLLLDFVFIHAFGIGFPNFLPFSLP